MKMIRLMLFAVLAAGALVAAPEDAIAYHGFVTKADGTFLSTSVPIKMVFRLHDAETGGKVLWARRIPVALAADGGFYVDLRDGIGDPVDGSTLTLAEAVAAVGTNSVWLSAAPEDSTAVRRDELVKLPTAFRARMARNLQRVEAEACNVYRLTAAKSAQIGTLTVKNSQSSTLNVTITEGDSVIDGGNAPKIQEGVEGFVFHEGVFGSYSENTPECKNDLYYILSCKVGQNGDRTIAVIPFPAGSRTFVGSRYWFGPSKERLAHGYITWGGK